MRLTVTGKVRNLKTTALVSEVIIKSFSKMARFEIEKKKKCELGAKLLNEI